MTAKKRKRGGNMNTKKIKINRISIHQKYNGKCGYCGITLEVKDMQVDHIIPQRLFVTYIQNNYKIPLFLTHLTVDDVNHFDNLMPSCRVCNKWKDTHYLEDFRREIEEQIKRLNDYSSNYRMAKKYGLIQETPSSIKFYFEQQHEYKKNQNRSRPAPLPHPTHPPDTNRPISPDSAEHNRA